jgi:quercetin dioxygenase-like cupin family protein
MRYSVVMAIAAASLSTTASVAQNQSLARPNLVHKEVVTGMPKGDKQEVKVFTATINPGDKTVYHTHRFPVTVYIIEGAFTLEMEGRPPVTVKTGESMVEPPHVKMTGYNKSSSETTKVLIFYVSDPDVPFLDPLH